MSGYSKSRIQRIVVNNAVRAQQASLATSAVSSSYALTASFALNGGGGSGSISSSYATTASYAITASYALNSSATSISYKSGSISPASFTGSPRTSTVSFASPFSNNGYLLSINSEDARIWTVQSKTASGFTLNSNSSVGLDNTVYWSAILA